MRYSMGTSHACTIGVRMTAEKATTATSLKMNEEKPPIPRRTPASLPRITRSGRGRAPLKLLAPQNPPFCAWLGGSCARSCFWEAHAVGRAVAAEQVQVEVLEPHVEAAALGALEDLRVPSLTAAHLARPHYERVLNVADLAIEVAVFWQNVIVRAERRLLLAEVAREQNPRVSTVEVFADPLYLWF